MGLLSPILRSTLYEGRPGVCFWCPGCDEPHCIPVAPVHQSSVAWGYNGNPNRPTFTPSLLVRSGHYVPGHEGETCWCNWSDKDEYPELKCTICHTFVRDGMIQFLNDCTHKLAGQTVPLPPWPTIS